MIPAHVYTHGKIYALEDPETSEIRYIGLTATSLKARLGCHLSPSAMSHKTYKNHWIKSLLKRGLKPKIILIDEVPVDQLRAVEKLSRSLYIAQIGARLTNLTDGGDGMLGYKHSPEVVERIRQQNLGRKMSEEAKQRISESKKGTVCTQEHREKLSKALIGIPKTPAHAAKVGAANKGKIISQDQRDRIAKALTGRKMSPESSEEKRLALADPEVKARMSKSHTGKKLSMEHKLKIAKSLMRCAVVRERVQAVKRCAGRTAGARE